LFYFSGHGIPGGDGEHYFASSEIDPDGPRRRGLSFDEYTDFMSDCNSKVIFSILDCCYSGAAKTSKASKTAESKKGENIIKDKLEGKGICTLSSCKPMQKSYLLKNNSVFTTFLLEGLLGGQGRSADEKGCITPESLLAYIDWKIRLLPADERRREQTPFLKCERSGGKIILSQFAKFSKVKVSQPVETRNTAYFLEQANNSFYKGNYKNAIKDYDKIIRDPNFVTAIYNKGLVLDKMGNYAGALKLYKQALDLRPRYFDAMFTMGYTFNNLENYEEAINWYDKALKIDPKDFNTLYNKGVALNALGYYEEAIKWYNKALKIDPKDSEALYNKALALHELGHYLDALIWYDKAMKINPLDIDILSNKGMTLYQLGKYQQAITLYNKALKIDPKDWEALYNKGLALHELGKFLQAIMWYDKGLKVKPENINNLNNKALALDELGKFREAIKWYNKALKIDPKNSDILSNKGMTLYQLGKYQQAITLYNRALKIDPKNGGALYNKGLALHELGHYLDALVWYDKALKIYPGDLEITESRNVTLKMLTKNKRKRN
jgi:tetratricopeptide (TPR) repeat protein